MRNKVILACTKCNRRNYTSMKNKQSSPDRIEVKKYCKYCNEHTIHRETK
ncbi:50S ribosomal protein L33 [Pseudalkalibacillus caeni]|uniref:Large ribosomal subunit protein bL33 n=1 Tax=Exobacillus caeni TaxID=2574798 RepID=A0A5R9F6Y4_9BACL|nr:50S ribosomal protein L33 [Pseudalkalibacillus caeni]TLS35535.1 50S ribosomal protein L33 [Pseudalkalibacillus caeni]